MTKCRHSLEEQQENNFLETFLSIKRIKYRKHLEVMDKKRGGGSWKRYFGDVSSAVSCMR
ncbi:hypothetical protein D3C84_1205610 [compost metagenome]